MRFLHQLMLFLPACLLSGVVLSYFPNPYIYLSILWAIVCLAASIMAGRSWAKALWLNLAVVALTLGAAELYFYKAYFSEEPLRETEYSDDETHRGHTDIVDLFQHRMLGWAPANGKSFIERARFENQLLYQVRYTIDDHGLRIASPSINTQKRQSNCLLFFGDSFTFGEGVKDDETMPYRVSERTERRYQAYNFAFLGYGPHQMLAQLQEGLVDAAIACKPAVAIYQALPDHVSRAAGLEAWSQFGPKYVSAKDNLVLWKGQFEDEKPHGVLERFRAVHRHLPKETKRYLEKSAMYRALLFMHRPVNDDDIDVFLRIVDRSRQIIESRYAEASFHVVFWDFSGENPVESKIIDGLKQKGIPVHLISTILPEYRGHEERFKIHHADGHPNSLAHDLVADYIVKTIITPSLGSQSSPRRSGH
jgi:hypothetical protein